MQCTWSNTRTQARPSVDAALRAGPVSPVRLVEDPNRERAAAFVRALEGMGERLRDAASRLIERLCWHRRQPMGRGLVCLELCPAYFSTTGEVAHTTAHRAWAEVRSRLGWSELPEAVVAEMGIRRRDLEPGQRHGRFLAVPVEVVEVAKLVADAAGIERAGGTLSDVEDRVAKSPTSRTVRCPWHQDGRPSLWLHPNGSARCYGCGSCGRWTESTGETVLLRRWLTAPPTERTGPKRTEERDGSITRASPPPSEVSEASSGVLVRRSVSAGRGATVALDDLDPFAALVRLDRSAAREASRSPAGLGCGEAAIPDRYLGLERHAVDRWDRVPWGWRPGAWRADGVTRFLLLDFDAATDGPIDSLGEPSGWGPDLGGRVEVAVLSALPGEVTGRIAVVRTGPSGLQVLVELVAGRVAREWVPGGWLRRAWATLAEALSPIVRGEFPGATADERATGPGRAMRCPGLRRTKARDGGILWVSRLAYVTPEASAFAG